MTDAGDNDRAKDQYGPASLARYEWIFSQDFLSSGARETAHHAAQSLQLRSGARVLDIGSGLGGAAFLFADSYSANVTGIDVLPDMVAEARNRARARRIHGLTFIQGDVLTASLPAESYNAIYSKDSFLHVQDKQALAKKLFQLLVPGGRVFFTDYLRAEERGGDEFESYASGSGYSLATAIRYASHLEHEGLVEIEWSDWTQRLIEILLHDIETMRSVASVSNAPTHSDIDYLVRRWELKLRCLRLGDMKWGSFAAQRPLPAGK